MIQLKKVRVSFPNIIEPTASLKFPNSDKRYRCEFILSPDDPQFAKAMEEIRDAAVEKWKQHAAPIMSAMDVKLRCWGKGEEKVKAETFTVYDGYAGNVYLKTSNYEDSPPIIYDAIAQPMENGSPSRAMEARKIYGGCYANAVISFKGWENNGSRGIRAKLEAIQFEKDGDPFGTAPPDLTGIFGAIETPSWL